MKRQIFWISLLAIFMFSSGWSDISYSAETYKLIIPPQPTQTGDKIEVLEIFWYGCPHCYDFEPYVEHWLESKPDYVEFIRIPGILGKGWIPHAKAYYTAEKLGTLDKIHRPLFDALHKDKEKIYDEKALKKFFERQGVDGDQFSEIYHSSYVDKKIKQAFIIGQQYKITGVPVILINGKYGTGASLAGGYKGIIATINELTEREKNNSTTASE